MKITPQDFIDMNKEFEEEGTPIVLSPIPTQEEIDNPTGVKLPTTFTPQKPMTVDGSDPWPHTRKLMKEIDDAFGYDTSGK